MNPFRRIRFSIRSLLFATILSALAVSIWVRPSGKLWLEIRPNGTIELNGKFVQRKSLANQLSEELRRHELWRKECEVVIATGDSTSFKSVVKLREDVLVALDGFENYLLKVERTESTNNET